MIGEGREVAAGGTKAKEKEDGKTTKNAVNSNLCYNNRRQRRAEQAWAELLRAWEERTQVLKCLVDNLYSVSPSLIVHYNVITAKWGKNPSPEESKQNSKL